MKIPEDVLRELRYEIGRADLDCANNYRAYRCKDSHLYDEWMAARKRGCCGFYETSIVDDNGDRWMVGCNYGH
jgi:hypothetical protein